MGTDPVGRNYAFAGTANKTLGANIWFAFGGAGPHGQKDKVLPPNKPVSALPASNQEPTLSVRNSVRYAHFITAFHPLATRKLIMTLQQIIHDAWQSRRPLQKRIPPEFLTYSYSPFERLPRAVFTIKDQTVAARTNCGAAAEKAAVRFTIMETSFTDALGTVNLMRDVYGNKAFDLVENRKSAVFALNNFTITHDNNQWIAVVNYDVTIFTYNPQI